MNMYTLKTKTLVKDIEDNTNTWKDVLCSWVGITDVIKMPMLPKASCRFSVIPIKILLPFFTGIGKQS
jgi:hypothetical protein